MTNEPFLVHYSDGRAAEIVYFSGETIPPQGTEFPPGYTVDRYALGEPSGTHEGQGYSYEVWVVAKTE